MTKEEFQVQARTLLREMREEQKIFASRCYYGGPTRLERIEAVSRQEVVFNEFATLNAAFIRSAGLKEAIPVISEVMKNFNRRTKPTG